VFDVRCDSGGVVSGLQAEAAFYFTANKYAEITYKTFAATALS
jgi:hypothetical protein